MRDNCLRDNLESCVVPLEKTVVIASCLAVLERYCWLTLKCRSARWSKEVAAFAGKCRPVQKTLNTFRLSASCICLASKLILRMFLLPSLQARTLITSWFYHCWVNTNCTLNGKHEGGLRYDIDDPKTNICLKSISIGTWNVATLKADVLKNSNKRWKYQWRIHNFAKWG